MLRTVSDGRLKSFVGDREVFAHRLLGEVNPRVADRVGWVGCTHRLGSSVDLAEENFATGGANLVELVLVVVANDFG